MSEEIYKIRIFSGQRFVRRSRHRLKHLAKRQAKKLRNWGFNVRIIKEGKLYGVYVGKKKR